jgi:hypothetical protein
MTPVSLAKIASASFAEHIGRASRLSLGISQVQMLYSISYQRAERPSHGRLLRSTQQFQQFLPLGVRGRLPGRVVPYVRHRTERAEPPLTDVNTHISPKSVYVALMVLLFVVMK